MDAPRVKRFINTLKKLIKKTNVSADPTFNSRHGGILGWGSRPLEKKIFLILVSLLLFFLYFSPYLIKGQDSYIQVYDNLDVVNGRNIFDGQYRGYVIPSDNIEAFYFPTMEKIFFVNEIFLDKLFFKIFGYWGGFIVNEIFYRLLGFMGLFFLLGRIKQTEQMPGFLKILLSFAFVSLPFFPGFHLSIAGIPLVILLFFNLYRKEKVYFSYVCLFLFTFYSRLMHVGVFIIFLLVLAAVYLAKKKRLHREFIFGILFLMCGWVISHYVSFYIQFFSDIPTTRVEMKGSSFWGSGFFEMLKGFLRMFLYTNIHARSFHLTIIVPSSIILALYLAYKKRFYHFRLVSVLFLFTVFASFTNAFSTYKPVIHFYEKFNIGFNLGRFFLLSPPAWYLLWGIILINFYSVFPKKKIGYFLIMGLLFFQVGFNTFHYTIKAYVEKPTFKEFFSVEQFSTVKRDLNLGKNDRIGCIGFYPAVANYNGLKTIGGYKNLYSLKFKQNFYKIIKDELEKNKKLKRYFLDWGSRAYLFDDKIGFRYNNQHYLKKKIKHIWCDLDIGELKKFGVTYLFSTVKIRNAVKKNLELVLISEKPHYYYHFYVYKLN